MLTICSMYLSKKVDQTVHYIGRKGEFTIYEGGLQEAVFLVFIVLIKVLLRRGGKFGLQNTEYYEGYNVTSSHFVNVKVGIHFSKTLGMEQKMEMPDMLFIIN